MTVEDLFGQSTGNLTWWQESLRAVVIFVYGLVLVRLSGRRAFGKWSALDIIVSIMVGSNLSRALTGGAPFIPTIVATTIMMALHWLVAQATARSPRISRLVEGRAEVLGRAGKLLHDQLLRNAISQNDVDEALRKSGLDDPAQTRQVTLEPSGQITVLKT
jgi:uncharacterized membrane protein YcaP (DUF421 family)